jgi:hypothetical protein
LTIYDRLGDRITSSTAEATLASNAIDYREPSDLRIVSGETFTDEDGQRCVAVYSLGLDAVTFVDATEEQRLLAAGVEVVESLPSGPDTAPACGM